MPPPIASLHWGGSIFDSPGRASRIERRVSRIERRASNVERRASRIERRASRIGRRFMGGVSTVAPSVIYPGKSQV
ncbi:MAG: hypothetical protein LBF90_00795 [Prevotellaceae bacterium]|nr:hypothetical protein [Prevotellaceae bacterium]